jgi:NAD(P)-dependent dehydrogenase (short-subunit alcohol dehydrogenase family)
VRVNGVEPGMVRTPAMGNLGDPALNARIAAGVPLGRLGEPAISRRRCCSSPRTRRPTSPARP